MLFLDRPKRFKSRRFIEIIKEFSKKALYEGYITIYKAYKYSIFIIFFCCVLRNENINI